MAALFLRVLRLLLGRSSRIAIKVHPFWPFSYFVCFFLVGVKSLLAKIAAPAWDSVADLG